MQDGLEERLLDTYGNSIFRLAYSYLHNYSDAEDILQETLIRYLQNVPQVTGPVHEKAWLLKVAANLSKNRIDYNRLRDTDELNDELVAEGRGRSVLCLGGGEITAGEVPGDDPSVLL